MLIPRATPCDDAHDVFMTLPPYNTGTGEKKRPGWWSQTPPGGPLSYEIPSYIYLSVVVLCWKMLSFD